MTNTNAVETADDNPGQPRMLEPQRAINVQPGDRIVIEVDADKATHENAQTLSEWLASRWPDVEFVVLAGAHVLTEDG